MFSRVCVVFLFLGILVGSGTATLRAADPRTSPAFSLLPGFPRTDMHGIANSGPVLVDLYGDRRREIMAADDTGCVWAWSASGNVLPGFPWKTAGACDYTPEIDPPLAIADIDGDGMLEVIAGTRGSGTAPGQRGKVFVWKANGQLLPGWPKEMDWNSSADPTSNPEIMSVAVANVMGDARLEIVAGTTNNSVVPGVPAPNVYAWFVDGTPVPGFPKDYRGAGVWGYLGLADLNRDGFAEVIAPRDLLAVQVYQGNGQSLAGFPVEVYVDATKTNYTTDPYMEFTTGAPAVGDLDGDGIPEIVLAGKVHDPSLGQVTGTGVVVLEPNGTRHPGWTVAKLGGAPLSSLTPPKQAPALVDLYGDGKLEIVVALRDGTIRAYLPDGRILWSYNYARGRLLYASEVAIGDINGDGKPEIVFGTYSPDGSANDAVGVMALDAQGNPITGFPLALPNETSKTRHGIQAGLALADLYGDCRLEIIAGSLGGALYAWAANAGSPSVASAWSTSRHDARRTGSRWTGQVGGSKTLIPSLASFVYLPLVANSRCP